MTAIELIANERARQILAKGYTLDHDDTHDHGEIAQAAAEYAAPYSLDLPEGSWAAGRDGDTRMQQLIKAGALIVAEMERLMRKDLLEQSDSFVHVHYSTV